MYSSIALLRSGVGATRPEGTGVGASGKLVDQHQQGKRKQVRCDAVNLGQIFHYLRLEFDTVKKYDLTN